MHLAPPQLVRFSTEMLPPGNRMTAFREQFARKVLTMDVVDHSGGKPRIDLTALKLGPVSVGSVRGTACEFIREAQHVKDGTGDLQLLLVGQGPVHARQVGQELHLDAGSAALFDYGRPHRSGGGNGGSATNVFVSPPMLKALVPHAEDRVGHTVRPGLALRLLDGYLRSLIALDAPPPADLAPVIAQHLVDLTAAVIGPTPEGREIIAGRGLKAARLQAALTEIARRAGNPGFDVDSVARRLGLSRRSLQRLLEETGKSFTEHVTARRLERAYAMLADPACTHLRIVEIALAAGFGDVSHFNRLFRSRFGETPSSARTSGGSGRD